MIFKKFMDSLSLLFEEGEKSFIRAIRYYESNLTDDLKSKMQDFYADEVNHTRWHRTYNQTLGVDLKEINAETKKRLQDISGDNPVDKLKTTLVLESITKAGAHVLPYVHKVVLKDIPEPMRSNWMTHSDEEKNHVPHVAEVGKYLGITRKELLAHSPKVVLGLLKQIVSNWRKLK